MAGWLAGWLAGRLPADRLPTVPTCLGTLLAGCWPSASKTWLVARVEWQPPVDGQQSCMYSRYRTRLMGIKESIRRCWPHKTCVSSDQQHARPKKNRTIDRPI
ncbi:hypothetical protein BZA05DRAFT_107884 [Tricharina praecox]|uniref:uncharacterized protein n=1 Tax=Tricharina praecox TaxID=43433 RepID=UPI00222029B0|nr:uncharacterized protein BZA05DRAFT_107884 [Tricharina praecox]KAI5857852.1 hypothetical protein BZA05DRAFT_107884 [Tricharina praecox]